LFFEEERNEQIIKIKLFTAADIWARTCFKAHFPTSKTEHTRLFSFDLTLPFCGRNQRFSSFCFSLTFPVVSQACTFQCALELGLFSAPKVGKFGPIAQRNSFNDQVIEVSL
jgi:hypothetical protein